MLGWLGISLRCRHLVASVSDVERWHELIFSSDEMAMSGGNYWLLVWKPRLV
jgi:hypothetical protein